jgi:hypothetical protein
MSLEEKYRNMINYLKKPGMPISKMRQTISLLTKENVVNYFKKLNQPDSIIQRTISLLTKENIVNYFKKLNQPDSIIRQAISHLNKKEIMNFLKGLNQPEVAAISILLILVIAVIDHITVYEIGFFVLYYIPIIFFSWYSTKIGAVIISLVCINVLYIANYHTGYQYTLTFTNAWNMTLLFASFLLVSLGAQHVSHLLKAEKELSAKLKNAINEIEQLSGLLPICASCKKIRDDKGYWENIEKYISTHTKATFTHGVCPECMQKYYPQFIGKKDEETS